MTAATLSRLPLSAGGALAGSVARGGLWIVAVAIDAGYWLVRQFMRAPVAVSCVAAVAGFSLLAGGNALFMQTERHPAPLFFSPGLRAAAHARPAAPAPRPLPRPAEIDTETTGSLGAVQPAPSAPIGNDDVLALQKKLVALDLLDAKPDGLFGRRTASAIRAFETKAGLKLSGKLTRELIEAVMAAPLPAVPQPSSAQTPAPVTPAVAASPSKPVAMSAPVVRQAGATAAGAIKPVPLAPLPASVPSVAALAAPASAVEPATSALRAAPAQSNLPMKSAAAAPVTQPVAQPQTLAAADAATVAMNRPPTAPSTDPAPAVPVSAAATPAQKLAAQMGTLPPEAPAAATAPVAETASAEASAADTSSDPGDGAGSTDPVLITKIQRGLASLGFLGAKIDGVPGEGTAKAIRNFEVFYDYRVTGLATPQLLDLLIQHGATI